MTYTIEHIDIQSDWTEFIKSTLIAEGYHITETDPDKVAIQYFNLQKRLISKTPRIIHKATNFNCPPELTRGLSLLESKITSGQDLKPNLSRLVKKLNKRDQLLNDWGIYHLHLGENLQDDGYMERSGPVLFARFDDSNAYFIDVMDHGSWTEQQMLKVIHDEWPQTISNYRIKDAVGLEQNFSNDDVGKLRNAQVNTFIEIESGIVYMGPGGGFVASGESMEVMMKVMDANRALKRIEKNVKENIETIVKQQLTDPNIITNEVFRFKLRVDDSNFFYLDEQNNSFSLKIT